MLFLDHVVDRPCAKGGWRVLVEKLNPLPASCRFKNPATLDETGEGQLPSSSRQGFFESEQAKKLQKNVIFTRHKSMLFHSSSDRTTIQSGNKTLVKRPHVEGALVSNTGPT